MTEQSVEEVVEVVDDEPIYYKPRSLTLVSTIAGILSWVVLVGFIAVIVAQYFILQQLTQGAPIATVIVNPQVQNWIYTNMVFPLFDALSLFFILQGVSIGLNVLLEIDFNFRESKS